MELEIHELLEPFHAVTEDALAPIKASMAANGYNPNAPITLYEGKILDGRHRYQAAVETGRAGEITVVDFVGDYAAARRHAAEANTRVGLSASQRAAIAAEMVNVGIGGKMPESIDARGHLYSHAQAAADWQIGERVISNIRGVLEYDRQWGTSIHAQTKAGEIASVAAALRARDDADAQRERMESERLAAAEREKAEREAEAERKARETLRERATGKPKEVGPDSLDDVWRPEQYGVTPAAREDVWEVDGMDAVLVNALMQMNEEDWDGFIAAVRVMSDEDWDRVKDVVYSAMLAT